jgi:hypothetical protein
VRVVDLARVPRQSALIGAAGEHYVLYRLLREGVLAAPAPVGAAIADLIVFDPATMSVGAMIQVKARMGAGKRSWRMSDKNQHFEHPRLFYALVDLAVEPPAVFVVPSTSVKEAIAVDHEAFLTRGGRDSTVRRYAPPSPWLERHRLELHRDAWAMLAVTPESGAKANAEPAVRLGPRVGEK